MTILKPISVVDMAELSRISGVKPKFKEVYELQGGFVDLEVADIVPGEPITVRWQIILDGFGNAPPETLDIRLTLDGFVVYERTGVLGAAVSTSRLSALLLNTNKETAVIVIKDANLARTLYKIPDNKNSRYLQLKAEVRATFGGATTHTGSAKVRLRREVVDASWWEWRSAPFESIAWKTGYTLVGDFVNKMRFARVDLVTAELSEVRSEENPRINPCEYVPIQTQARNSVAAGAFTGFTFTLLHDWKWIMSTSYLIAGPINKTFAYAVWFYFTDEFGNLYSGQCSHRRNRHVGVPKSKRLAGVAAQTAVANAAFWSAIWAFPIAAGWYGVAAAMGAIAKDPPAPDLKVDEEVVPRPIPLPRWNDDSVSTYKWTIALVEHSAKLAGLENARTGIRAKLLGARLTMNQAAERRQLGAYENLERQIAECARDIETSLQRVRDEIVGMDELQPSAVQLALEAMLDQGLSSDALQVLRRLELEAPMIAGVARSCANHEAVSLAYENGFSLAPFVASLTGFAREILAESETIYRGEIYVAVEASEEIAPGNEDQSDEYVNQNHFRRRGSGLGCCGTQYD